MHKLCVRWPQCPSAHGLTHMPVTHCSWGVCIKGQLTEAEWVIDGFHWGLGVLTVSSTNSLYCLYLPCIYWFFFGFCEWPVITRACVLHVIHLSSARFIGLVSFPFITACSNCWIISGMLNRFLLPINFLTINLCTRGKKCRLCLSDTIIKQV